MNCSGPDQEASRFLSDPRGGTRGRREVGMIKKPKGEEQPLKIKTPTAGVLSSKIERRTRMGTTGARTRELN